MKADSISVQDFFNAERRHLVPLFQRPYVWKQEDQWEPLWQDLRQLAERALSRRPTRPHFLGAVVLEQIKTGIRDVQARLVIDGQQRLTTLQLLTGAMRELCREIGEQDLYRRLDRLTRNEDAPAESAQAFKVWPTNLDRPPYQVLMALDGERDVAERVVAARAVSVGEALLVEAFAYFHKTIDQWIHEAEPPEIGTRMATLIDVVRNALNLVVIDLGDDDEAQVIFETLNARGTPLLPADLVKNYLFREAENQHLDLEDLYERLWRPFDEEAGYWRKRVRQGRLYRPQIDIYLQHYLTLETRDEVSASHLFAEFKEFASTRPGRGTEAHLAELQRYSRTYKGFGEAPSNTRRGLFFHRLMVMETTTLIPFLLGFFDRYGKAVDDPSISRVLTDLESYLVRRMVCRLTTKNYNRFFLELIGALDDADSSQQAALAVRRVLLEGTAESTLWPDDETFEASWRELPAYRSLNRGRLRMILEALESAYRTEMNEKIELRGTLTIEHLLPQGWRETWPLPPDAERWEAERRRESLVHRFGNLTLLTQKLNPSVSNASWERKHRGIVRDSALALNRCLQDQNVWDEEAIERRTDELFGHACRIWPYPSS